MNYIIGLVGPSGSGKTALINEALNKVPNLKVIKSTTTRAPRGPEDDPYYEFLSREKFEKREKNNDFVNVEHYAGNKYGTYKAHLNEILTKHHGIMAIVETAIKKFKDADYKIKVIKIIPLNQQMFRGKKREAADLQRSQVTIEVDKEIMNSFEPGGLEKAALEMIRYIESL
ncbi:MAG TPA: hypothetical protein VD998_01010 [Verrucomicrobiae bacterium]|nr:hypothetical protein [Verrucomicrobiae bacterium]